MAIPVFCSSGNASQNASADIQQLKLLLYCVVTPLVGLLGILGNVLNLLTLRHAALQSVPFMYIRFIAIFDLIGLTLILFASLRIGGLLPTAYALAFYQAHAELALVNAFLTASLYTAVVLTVERYMLVCRPLKRRVVRNPRAIARLNVVVVFVLALALHTPMCLQWAVRERDGGGFVPVNNPATQCRQPWATAYFWYERAREGVRLGGVLLMTVLNVIITRKLQVTKRKRRQLTLRGSAKSGDGALLSSFAEKKLTALMIAITIIYIVGNMPQAVLMVIHEDTYERKYSYQLFRGFANLMEVLNHCLNFYVFCVASRDYSQAFLQCLRGLQQRTPCCPAPDNYRRESDTHVAPKEADLKLDHIADVQQCDSINVSPLAASANTTDSELVYL